jgi:general stress protein YciG
MDAQRQREVSSIGGHTAHAGGRAHRFTPEEARIDGRKGGTAVSRDREHMAAIGRRGGRSPLNRKAGSPKAGTE